MSNTFDDSKANPEHLKVLGEGVEAWNTWRSQNPYVLPVITYEDLGQLDLSRSNLSNVEFSGCNLVGSKFYGANLYQAELFGAKLQNCDFRRANMAGAKLHRTDLNGATLEGAYLYRADLIGSFLKGTDFRRAQCRLTAFHNVDLREAVGLDEVQHMGPSSIDIATLARSGGTISEAFLRGCGVPDKVLDYTKGLFGEAIRFYSCFVSYSHSEKSFARRLHDQLQARGIRCWLDEHDMKPGDRVLDVVTDAIRLHDRILLCCSESSLNSWWVKDEIRKALERERHDGRDIIIPLMIDRYLPDGWEDGMAADLRSRLAADFTGWEHDNAKFEEQFEKVVKSLRTNAE